MMICQNKNTSFTLENSNNIKMERLWNSYIMCVYTYMHTQTEVELCPWVQENMNSAGMGLCAKTSGALLQLRSEQLNGHL